MKTLVLGGTGMVGSRVVAELLERGEEVRVLTRSAERVTELPAGVEGVVGDLLDPATVRSVFQGMDAAFVVNPVSTTEAHEGLMAVNGARLGGVGRVVYLSVQDVDGAPHLPHFGSKIAVETAIRASGIPWTILRPSNFYQNDYWMKDGLLQYGTYAQPLGDVGVSRVDVRDIGEMAAIALTTDGHDGKTYNVVGPEALTGVACADAWSRALGRPIAYAGDDLDAWEQMFLQYLPAWMVFDFRVMYDFFQEKGLRGTAEDVRVQTEILGHPPRSFDAFVAETAGQWGV
jgi:uncharacterized protein YbjT (DUF2867 family)